MLMVMIMSEKSCMLHRRQLGKSGILSNAQADSHIVTVGEILLIFGKNLTSGLIVEIDRQRRRKENGAISLVEMGGS